MPYCLLHESWDMCFIPDRFLLYNGVPPNFMCLLKTKKGLTKHHLSPNSSLVFPDPDQANAPLDISLLGIL